MKIPIEPELDMVLFSRTPLFELDEDTFIPFELESEITLFLIITLGEALNVSIPSELFEIMLPSNTTSAAALTLIPSPVLSLMVFDLMIALSSVIEIPLLPLDDILLL